MIFIPERGILPEIRRLRMDVTVLELDVVDSTNTYGKTNFDVLADATLISANRQTAGRGRLDRKWLSPPGKNLTVSFIMKEIHDPFLATCAVSLAVLDLLRSAAPDHDFYIKWPNDIYCADAKIAGILSEGVIANGKFCGVVAGMGINVNLSAEDIAGLDQNAVSLSILLNRHLNVKKLCSGLAKSLKTCYISYSEFPDRLFRLWQKENRLLGRRIIFDMPDGKQVTGVLKCILDDGSIQVDPEDGTDLLQFRCGDVRIVKGSWLNGNEK